MPVRPTVRRTSSSATSCVPCARWLCAEGYYSPEFLQRVRNVDRLAHEIRLDLVRAALASKEQWPWLRSRLLRPLLLRSSRGQGLESSVSIVSRLRRSVDGF